MTKKKYSPLILAILDGWGKGPKDKTVNAIFAAKTPFVDYIEKNYPHTRLGATGKDVGLEENQMSGSETGHMNIGAGRIIKQDVRAILEAIGNGSFFQNPALLSSINHAKKNHSNIHLIGLLGNNDSPHAHPDILSALLVMMKKNNLCNQVFLHLFTDGRDSFPKSALDHWKILKTKMRKIGCGKVVSVSGRFYGMDRTKNWDRLMSAYEAMTDGKGEKYESFEKVIKSNYQRDHTDEYIEPSLITTKGKATTKISDNDTVIFFNQRSDRARQLSKLFVGTKTNQEKDFPNHKLLHNLAFVALTDFGPDLNLKTAFPTNPVVGTMPSALAEFRQLYISETEKFAHVTYFVNGGYAEPVAGEERIMIESVKTRSYAQYPEMSAEKITQVIKKNVQHESQDIIVVNFPNADMVGHTGNFKACIRGIEFVDQKLKELYQSISKKDGAMIITADHGNADIMIEKKTNRPFTFHTKNPVPFTLVSEKRKIKKVKLEEGILSNITPTVIDLLGKTKPEIMKKGSLIK